MTTEPGSTARAAVPELEALLGALQGQREHVLACLDGLGDADLRRSVLPSGWTPLGLVRHLTIDVERFWFRFVMAGEDLVFPTDAEVWNPQPVPPPADVLADYRRECALSDAVARSRPLDSRQAREPTDLFPDLPGRDLRWTLLHVVTETANHAGQLDVVRELVDGHQHLVLTQDVR